MNLSPISVKAMLLVKPVMGNSSLRRLFGGNLQLTLEELGKFMNPGHFSSVGMPMIRKIFEIWSTSPCPGNIGSPVSSSANIQPTDHISMGVE